MEAESPPKAESVTNEGKKDENEKKQEEEIDYDTTIHGFNMSNITVIEKQLNASIDIDTNFSSKHTSCEGSDSGVEVVENQEPNVFQRTLSTISTNSQEFDTVTPARSCDSSIISCCSNYEEAYNLLARRNSTLLEDYKLRTGDGTSEGGSESSSVAGSTTSKTSKRITAVGARKKVNLTDNKTKNANTQRSRTKPPLTPKSTNQLKPKAIDRLQEKTPKSKSNTTKNQTPTSLTNPVKKELKRTSSVRVPSTTRTPAVTPTDDGRWPSVNSKPAPLMTRSLRGILPQENSKARQNLLSDSKTLEKYATLPRRRKEKSADSIKDLQKSKSRESSMTRAVLFKKQNSRESTPAKTLPPYPRKKPTTKTKIYHETNIQTALTIADIEKALSGIAITPTKPQDAEKVSSEIQVDTTSLDMQKLQEQLKSLKEKYEELQEAHKEQTSKLKETEDRLKEETLEKDGLKEELRQNSERVLAILRKDNDTDDGENVSSDSLMVLETRFQDVSQIVIKQEEEISKLNACCRSLQKDLDKSLAAQKTLLQQQQELEAESMELQDFMQAEKSTLTDALKDAEGEIKKLKKLLEQKEKEVGSKQQECAHLSRISEQRRQENISLQARFSILEKKSLELLIHQGSSVSGAAVALSALITRLESLVEQLINSYSISDQELEDVIFHNEAYSNSSSSPELTPEKSNGIDISPMSLSKKKSSFMSAVINAIKNATGQTTASALKELNNSDSTEMLDSETEPCLMMEHVLEDVVVPDGHSHNMISSGHSMLNSSLTHSGSLNDLSQAILNRQMYDSCTESLNTSISSDTNALNELYPNVSIVDQVIEVDNLITKMLKVIRVVEMSAQNWVGEMENELDDYVQQVEKQKETNKIVVRQLKDWEVLGAQLKTEVKELMQQSSKKNTEIESLKVELNHQRKEVERLNQDVCELSTALSKYEIEGKTKDEEAINALKSWEKTGEVPSSEILGRLITAQTEIRAIKEKLLEKEKQLNELTQEFIASRQVLSESLKEAVGESKKLYEAIDKALETLHEIQNVVQQCPPLAKLQRELEETSFHSASSMPIVAPPDCNANAALLQAVANIDIATPINTTA